MIARLNRSPVIGNLVYTAKRGPARGLKRQGGMGWLLSFIPRTHGWEAEEAFLNNLDWRGLTVFDVGGDQGLFTLFFATRVGSSGQVVVFEPNPRSVQRIRQNLQHNNLLNVRVLPVGLGEARATLQLISPALEPARGSATPAIAEQIRHERDAVPIDIEVNSLDSEMRESGLPAPDFIKLDVEGMEYPALKGMETTLRSHLPRLSIEIHGAGIGEKESNVRRVVGILEDLGYRMRHIESGERITSANAARASRGHLYCDPQK
jgi:FkbM family methyltransferase